MKNEEAYEGHLPFTDSSSAFGMPCMVTSGAEALEPIIDMHLHEYTVADFGVGVGRTPAVCSSNEETVHFQIRKLLGNN